jgi:hypothetical protein
MRRLGGIAAAAFIVLGGAAVAGCGGGDDGDEPAADGSAAAEAEIAEVIETIFTSSDPAQCSELTTTNALRQALPDAKEGELVAGCRKSLAENAEADSVEIAEIAVDGATATAVATPDGGPLTGTAASVAMVDAGGQWKFDGFTALELRDRDEFIGQIRGRLADEGITGTGLSPRDTDCIADHMAEEASNSDFERFVVDADRGVLYDAVRDCMGGGVDLTAITLIVREQFVEAGLSTREANCIAGIGITALEDATLADFAEDPELQRRYEQAIKKSAYLCG